MRASMLIPAFVLALVLLLAVPLGGASCHYCFNPPEPADPVWDLVWRFLP